MTKTTTGVEKFRGFNSETGSAGREKRRSLRMRGNDIQCAQGVPLLVHYQAKTIEITAFFSFSAYVIA